MINPEILREYDIRGIYEKSLTLNDVTKIALSITKILINNKSPNIIILTVGPYKRLHKQC